MVRLVRVVELVQDDFDSEYIGFDGSEWSRWGLQVPRGQGVGLQGPKGSRGRPTGFQGVEG